MSYQIIFSEYQYSPEDADEIIKEELENTRQGLYHIYYKMEIIDQDGNREFLVFPDWIGDNGAITRTSMVINPDHLICGTLQSQLYIMEELRTSYRYLKNYLNFDKLIRMLKIAAVLRKEETRD